METGVAGLRRRVCERNVEVKTYAILYCNAGIAVPPSQQLFDSHSPPPDDVKQAVREAATIFPIFPCPLQVDLCLLTVKVVSESRVMWTTSVPILVFLGLSVLDLGPMYATDVDAHHRLVPPILGAGLNNALVIIIQ